MKKKERQEKLMKDFAKTFEYLMTSITYIFLLGVSGFTIFMFSNVVLNSFNSLSVTLLVGNFLIFGVMFYSWFDYINKAK